MTKPSDHAHPPKLPPKPIRPEPHECCESGCDKCVFDYYEEALERWEKQVAKLQKKSQRTDAQ